MSDPIDILLATRNSSPFLEEQLESIVRQNCNGWRLMVRDGGSTDTTLDILDRWAKTRPKQISLLPFRGHANTVENYSALLQHSTAPYVMFSDHDDVWKKDKISKSLDTFKRIESQKGPDTPLLLFTDRKVVDKDLKIIADSCFLYQNIDPQNISLNRLLVQNVPSGCTMLFNRALVDACGVIPPDAVMHDYWLALVACSQGEIFFLDEPTVLYRQHGNNLFGAAKYGNSYFWNGYKGGLKKARRRLYQNVAQAKVFLETYNGRLSSEQREKLEAFSSLGTMSPLKRRITILKHGFFKCGFRRNLGMMLLV